MKAISMFFAVAVLSIFYVTANADSEVEITVSAAISLKNALEKIGKLFEDNHKGVKVIYNFGASGSLARQIEGGAPVDVFAPADQKDMDDIDNKGLVVPGTRVDFVGNSVVLIVPASETAAIDSFDDLKLAKIKKVAIGNPKTVPAGRYAQDVLNFYKVLPTIGDKLILAENARQALDYVARGEVDAGVVYLTDAMLRSKEVKVVSTASMKSHRPIAYPIAVVRGTKNKRLSGDFIKAVKSETAQGIFRDYGFTTAK
ncbi:molybdenum ABC transporter periplasmic molybdate-binding protein [Candidatus Magnetobacterium bavaricum]|uniref:Molybdenum ABC transporter periplasmic molybdate-binding protein n=1 Tax=Candidatus Magnetobacterium bavaricum TaxID=29290 RepID=A0A0F3GSA6_9BACT|nr:molybdenum ABC transporter periplasmic molybdate-binding protein [Candidatus Magnetobacterium bavaricum]